MPSSSSRSRSNSCTHTIGRNRTRSSPTSVRDAPSPNPFTVKFKLNPCNRNINSNADSFEKAFRNGTVLPYFLDSAVRSFDFSDIGVCSFLAVTGSRLYGDANRNAAVSVGNVAATDASVSASVSASGDCDACDDETDYSSSSCETFGSNVHTTAMHVHVVIDAIKNKTKMDLDLHKQQAIEISTIITNSNNKNDSTVANGTCRTTTTCTTATTRAPLSSASTSSSNSYCHSLRHEQQPQPSVHQYQRQHLQQQRQQTHFYNYNYERDWLGHRPLAPWIMSTMSDDSSSNNSPAQASGKSARSGSTGSSSKGGNAPSSSSSTKQPADAITATGASTKRQSTPKSSSSTKLPADSNTGSELEEVHVQHPGADRSALKELPALRDAPPAKREELFILKLKLCSVIFSFDDPMADKRGKDMKRQTLLELVDYVNTPVGQKIFTESVMGDLMAMVFANVCRALPPATDDFDPEEDEPVLEPAWPHLQVAYEFFLRFIVSSEVNAKAAKKYVDQKFCLQLVELFDSEDPRERDYLKTILHRIYGKFMSHRSFIRRAISNVFYRFVYETERHNGIGELLEILGSIINGFAIPLKKEHLQFLVRALIPLHKPKCVALYHQQLSYCIIQYVEKDADTATPILNGFFKCWPWSSSGKQVMFLNELEEILELLGADQLAQVSDMLFTNLARCLDSEHFQVVERALFLWNNEHLVNSGCLSRLNAQAVLPIIYGPLYKNSSGHWNATVEGLAQNVLKMYMEYDLVLYDRCTANYFREEEDAKRKLTALEDRWSAIEKVASTSTPSILVN